MDDQTIAALLEAEGERFRREHQTVTAVRRRHAARWWPALTAGLAAAALAVGVTLVVSDRDTSRPTVPGGSASALPTSSATPGATQEAERSVELTMTDVVSTALSDRWLAVSGGDEIGQSAKQWIEVRRPGQLKVVVTRIDSIYAAGGPICLALEGDILFWTDSESIPTDYDPGPPTRWSLWQRDLATGRTVRLASGLPKQSPGEIPCTVVGAGRALWSLNGVLTVRDLATDTNQTFQENGYPIASTADGVVVNAGTTAVLRPAPDFAARRVLASTPAGTKVDYWAAGPGHLLAFTHPTSAEQQDPTDASVCELPACASLRKLRSGEAMYGAVVTERFAVWQDLTETPTLLLFDGSAAPPLPSGYVPAHTLSASGSRLLYATEESGGGRPATLHLIDVGR